MGLLLMLLLMLLLLLLGEQAARTSQTATSREKHLHLLTP